mmetsp:Transcript_125308/g.401327  ORF Transcript_125308/g.401327 Transcript_125308/m.401327 type:complete len:220 (+) Transcript_125308:326-985(+)
MKLPPMRSNNGRTFIPPCSNINGYALWLYKHLKNAVTISFPGSGPVVGSATISLSVTSTSTKASLQFHMYSVMAANPRSLMKLPANHSLSMRMSKRFKVSITLHKLSSPREFLDKSKHCNRHGLCVAVGCPKLRPNQHSRHFKKSGTCRSKHIALGKPMVVPPSPLCTAICSKARYAAGFSAAKSSSCAGAGAPTPCGGRAGGGPPGAPCVGGRASGGG